MKTFVHENFDPEMISYRGILPRRNKTSLNLFVDALQKWALYFFFVLFLS
jgi:hypothetical protein